MGCHRFAFWSLLFSFQSSSFKFEFREVEKHTRQRERERERENRSAFVMASKSVRKRSRGGGEVGVAGGGGGEDGSQANDVRKKGKDAVKDAGGALASPCLSSPSVPLQGRTDEKKDKGTRRGALGKRDANGKFKGKGKRNRGAPASAETKAEFLKERQAQVAGAIEKLNRYTTQTAAAEVNKESSAREQHRRSTRGNGALLNGGLGSPSSSGQSPLASSPMSSSSLSSSSVQTLWKLACESDSGKSCDIEPLCFTNCSGRKSPFCICAFKKCNQSKRKGLWRKDQDLLMEIGDNPAFYERRKRWSNESKAEIVSPAGLKNLGATCYANSVLQCLFNITGLRRDLLMISAGGTKDKKGAVPEDLLVIDGIHRLFAEMQFSPNGIVNPGHFLTQVLQLNQDVQQDSQEFWTLLHYSIDAALQKLEDKRFHNILKSSFVGQTSYKTVCKKCKQLSDSSKNLHDFQVLELEVKDSGSLQSSLETYLAEEVLDGDNKYFCEFCNSRQDAVRRTEINNLPKHLILQLKRFRFDLKTFERKKIKTNFRFPLSIDMDPYLAKDKSQRKHSKKESLYDIESIILHKGKSAAQGHYISLVKRDEDDQWWQFDDQNVTCIGPDLHSLNNFVKDETREDSLMSTQMYIIVYRKREASKVKAEEISVDILPPASKNQVSSLLGSFKESKESYYGKRDLFLKNLQSKREEVEKLLEYADEDYDLKQAYCISSESLSKWTSTLKGCDSIDMKPFTCRHNLIDPRRIEDLKLISPQSYSILRESVPVENVLSADMLCVHCLKEVFEKELKELKMEGKNRIMLGKYHQNMLKTQSSSTFYISKRWFQRWTKNSSPSATMQISPTDDIICIHGNISPSVNVDSDLKEIDSELWQYFSDACSNLDTPAPEIRSSQKICEKCSGSLSNNHSIGLCYVTAKSKKKGVEAIKEITSSSPMMLKSREVYTAIPIRWYYEWKKLLAEGATMQSLVESISRCVWSSRHTCKQHGKLLGKEPRVAFTKIAGRRNSWHQSIHESNMLILTSPMWKILRNAVGFRDNVDFEVQVEGIKELSPRISVQRSFCSICPHELKGEYAKGEGINLWIYGAFDSATSGSSSKTAIELNVDQGITVNDLKEAIEKKTKQKGIIHALLYCQEVLKDNQTLSSLNIDDGDALHFETLNELSSDAENGHDVKNFEGTRLMS